MSETQKVKREKLIVGVLLLVFMVTLGRTLMQMGIIRGPQSAKSARQAPASVNAQQTSEVSEGFRQFQERNARLGILEETQEPPADAAPVPPVTEEVTYTASEFRDPMASLLPGEAGPSVTEPAVSLSEEMAQSPGPPSIDVQGIIWGPHRPQALIDGEVYDLGDTIHREGDIHIMEIDRDGITVDVQGATFRVAVSPIELTEKDMTKLVRPAPSRPAGVSARSRSNAF